MEYGLYIKSEGKWLLVSGPYLKHEQDDLQKILELYKEFFPNDQYTTKEYTKNDEYKQT